MEFELPKQGVASGGTELIVRDGIRDQLKEFDTTYDTTMIFEKDKKLISVWMQAIVPAVHVEENESSTRFSSLHTIYARQGQRRWHLFHEMKKVFEVV